MIRFIDLTGQIYDTDKPVQEHLMAYFDTVSDRFLEFETEQVFVSLKDMLKFIESVEGSVPLNVIERLRKVTPKEFLE